MKKIGVILSGCGVKDGSEIHESVLTLLAIDRLGASYQCFAPDMEQRKVVNHLTNHEVTTETRRVLVEASRIARGNIKPVTEASVDDLDALIFPGGSGAALNISDFAIKGANCSIRPDVLTLAKGMHEHGKPLGFICIAPVMIPLITEEGTMLTIGNDHDTANIVAEMGGKHVACTADKCVIDKKRKIVSTPAYMLARSISEVDAGITELVQAVLDLI